MSSMRLHKELVIHCLRNYPEDLDKILTGWKGTAEEAIQFLENDPRQFADEFNEETPEAE